MRGDRIMGVFDDIPKWAQTSNWLMPKPKEPVKPMPTPTLDEIEAMEKPKRKPGRPKKK